MNDAVSHALVIRRREPEGLSTTLVASIAAHVVAIALLVVMPSSWRTRTPDVEREVMQISLGGAPGPRAGGMSPLGGRPIQALQPVPDIKPEPVRPPAPKPPEMVVPTKEVKPPPKPAPKPPDPKTTTTEARGRTPTTGKQVQAGNAVAQTGGKGIGFGLSTGGGGTGGEINFANFCCPEYLQTMLDLIQRNWTSKQQVAGTSTVKFTIRRDGSVTGVEIARSSGFAVLDLNAQRSILMTRLPALPSAYTNEQLTIHLTFDYQR